MTPPSDFLHLLANAPDLIANLPPALAETVRKAFVSPKRQAANESNAQKSTGPRTEEGKKISRLNAFRHGITGQVHILPDAERIAAEAFIAPIVKHLAPVGPDEAALARHIATAHWRLNRVCAVEDNLFAFRIGTRADCAIAADYEQIGDAFHVALAFAEQAPVFAGLSGYERRIQRSLETNRKQLQESQRIRKEAEAKALSDARLLCRYAQQNGETFDPEGEAKANGGSVFPIDVLDAANLRDFRLKAATRTAHKWTPLAKAA